jgi:uncharacterized flavoprotein (TIGR03862 family)
LKKTISIIGGGASALILGCELDPKKYTIGIYEKNTALARKFLVAGDGGLNLTHSEDEAKFILRYTPSEFLETSFKHFSNKDLVVWLNNLGIETFVGSSGRIFPKKDLKPIEVLNSLEEKIKNNHVTINFKHEWNGFLSNNELLFKTPAGNKQLQSDVVIFCLGGASWPVTGSKGEWITFFNEKGIKTMPFKASNCSFNINWPKEIIKSIEGKPLKNISIACGNKVNTGEIVLTSFGIEGSGAYPLSPQIREELNKFGHAKIYIDLKPLLSSEDALKKITNSRSKLSYTENIVKQLNLNKTQIILLKSVMSKSDFLNPIKFVNNLKNLELLISSLGPIEDAISSVGGISLTEISEDFELKKIKNNFVIGEMLDYDAPTGGYLLQSCFSMGKHLADHLNDL